MNARMEHGRRIWARAQKTLPSSICEWQIAKMETENGGPLISDRRQKSRLHARGNDEEEGEAFRIAIKGLQSRIFRASDAQS